jgi:hypothetical protein
MPHFKKAFPSKYLSATDLDDGPIVATIKSVASESVGSGEDATDKLVVKFREKTKPLVCNLTRAQAIADLVGSGETDRWAGCRIQIARGQTTFRGKRVACLLVEAAPPQKPRQPAPAAAADPEADQLDPPDDAEDADVGF